MRFLGPRGVMLLSSMGLALRLFGQTTAPIQYNPPPFAFSSSALELAFPGDPPAILNMPFDSGGIPYTSIISFPPEDPVDDPFNDVTVPPLLKVLDPFPAMAALLTGELGFSGIVTSGAVTNVTSKLMPFPVLLPFHPWYTGTNATATRQTCDPTTASKLIIPESESNTVAFLSTCPVQLTSHLITGSMPAAVAETPDGSVAIVSNAGSGNLSFINTASQSVTATLPLTANAPLGSTPGAIAVLPDGSRAYVNDYDSGPGSIVWVIDLASQRVIGQINVGAFPSSSAVSPDGSQVWITCHGDNTVYVIDTLTNSVVAFIRNIMHATGIAFTPNGTAVYVAEGSVMGGQVDVIDPATFVVQTTIPVGNLPEAVVATPSGRHVFVANGLSNSISEISTVTNTVIRIISLPMGVQNPLGLTFVY